MVQGTIEQVQPDTGRYRDTDKITHVYRGPQLLLGQSFTAYSDDQIAGSFGRGQIEPPFKMGEDGVFSVSATSNGLANAGAFPNTDIQFPQRAKFSHRYSQALAWASAVETVCNDSKKRESLLEKFMESPIPEISYWPVNYLAATEPGRVRDIFKGLGTASRISVKGQIAINENRCGWDESYKDSDERKAMLNQWFSIRLDEYDTAAVFSRVNMAAQMNEMNEEQLFQLIEKYVRDDLNSVHARGDAIYIGGSV